MKYSYCYFEIVLHLFVAFTFLIEVFKGKLPQKLYDFFNNNRNIIFGCYYVYLAVNIYRKKVCPIITQE